MQAHLQGLVRLPPSRQIQQTLLSLRGRRGAPAAATTAAIYNWDLTKLKCHRYLYSLILFSIERSG
jgi:hypothetical protein